MTMADAPRSGTAVDARVVTDDGVALHVETVGAEDSPTILLVHGWPDTGELWRPVVDRLAPRFHVAAFDARGAGRSDHPTNRADYLLTRLAADIAAVADHVSPDAPIHLVGHDWGGVAGWEAVADGAFPGRFATFTVISGPSLDHAAAALRALARGGTRARLRMVDQVVRFAYILSFLTPLPGLARRWSPDGRLARGARGVIARALHIVERHEMDDRHPAPTVAIDAAHGTEMYLANILQRLRHPSPRRVSIPVQMIEATRDPVVRAVSLDASTPWVDDLQRHQLRGGHWLVRSHPAEVADLIERFVSAHAPA